MRTQEASNMSSNEWRDSDKWRKFNQKQKRYDGWQCQECGKRGGELHTHHIKPVSKGGAIFDSDNVTTLCRDCHRKAHADDEFAHLLDL